MRTFFLAALCVFLAAPALAQRGGEAYVTQASNLVGASVPDLLGNTESSQPVVVGRFLADPFGFARFGLGGFTNSTFVDQTGVGNAALLEQQGERNSALVVEIGNGNAVSLLQLGDDNAYGAVLVGDDNETTAQQLGNGNRYGLVFTGSDLRHRVLQQGDGNEALQIGANGARPADVEQYGNGLQLLIEHN